MTREEEFYDYITWYAIKNWEQLTRKASRWKNTKHCIPISVQLSRYFNVDEVMTSRIARNVAIMKHIGIVFKEE